MTKQEIRNELKGMWNGIRMVGKIRVAKVCWHPVQWKIIKPDTSWSEVAEKHDWPIQFYYQEQLIRYIYENQ